MVHLRSLLLLVVLLASASAARGQESGLSFLRIGPNAAAGAMGDAYVAYSRDAFSTYWNPAGLAVPSSNALALSYHSWVADVQTYALSTRFQAGERGGAGLFVHAMGTGGLEVRDRPGEPAGRFNVQFLSAGAAYGRSLGPLRAGVTAKYLSERIFTHAANGYAFDVGVQADVIPDGLVVGAAVQNLGEMSELNAEATPLPKMVRGGIAAFPLAINARDDGGTLVRVLVAAEVVHLFTGSTTQFHAGVGARFFDVLDVRTGAITNDTLRRYTFGLGLDYEGFRFDYAVLPFQNDFQGPGHMLTLHYGW